MSFQSLVMVLGLIGVVILLAGLLSGFIERSNFPQVAAFLLIGAAIGPWGLGLVDIGLDSPLLMAAATVSLALVLFTDALTVRVSDLKSQAGLAALILGPGTLAAAAAVALGAYYLLGLHPAMAAILGAALASTDPVLLRGFLRRSDLPVAARHGLRLESSLNDVVLLPIVLIAMSLVSKGAAEGPGVARLAVNMLVVGPLAGAAVAWIAIWLLEMMRKSVGVRRDYESIYSLGVALAAYAMGEALHSSGFLAAFAAGLTIAMLDVELCDCFREYGETTAEMMLLFTFVLLGVSLIWSGLSLVSVSVAAFVAVALFARPLILFLALQPSSLDARSVRIISWFGPRGLSSLLLVLIPVFAGVSGSSLLFQMCALVVLVSVTLHGASIMLFGKAETRRASAQAAQTAASSTPLPSDIRMSASELQKLHAAGEPVWLLDVRSQDAYLESDLALERAVRIDPQQARRAVELAGVPKEAWAALFCT